MANASIIAVTARGVEIASKAPFPDRKSAVAWAVEARQTFPGLRLVRRAGDRLRTIWRDPGPTETLHGA